MKTWMAAALALATVGSANAAPLDQFDWRTQEGFEQAYRAGVQYGFDHGSSFRTASRCSAENCLIVMGYDVADESYYFITWLGSADNRGNEICAERPDHHLTCANDHGRVWTMHHVDGDWKEVRVWQYTWPIEPPPVAQLIDGGFAAVVRTQKGFEQAYHEAVQYGFEHGSYFSADPTCSVEHCRLSMNYSVNSEQYGIYTWLGSAELHENRFCLQRRDDQITCATDHGQVWTKQYVDGDWKEIRRWQNSWPVEPLPVAKLIDIGLAALGFVMIAAFGVAVLLFPTMRLAALLARASLFVIPRLPSEWRNRFFARVTPSLVFIQRWREIKNASVASAYVSALISALVLAWRKRRALKLVGRDFEAFIAQRDAHWMQQLAQGGGAIPPERLMALITLTHPDKHNGSRLATETTQWLLALRASRVA
jgi:hypothetical protein